MVRRVKKQKRSFLEMSEKRPLANLSLLLCIGCNTLNKLLCSIRYNVSFFFGVHVSITREPCSENDITDVNQNVLGSQLTARAWLQKLIHVSCPEKDRFS